MTGLAIASVVVAAPAALFGFLLLSALVESRLVAPDERARKVVAVLDRPEEPDEVERLVADLAEEAMPAHRARTEPAGAATGRSSGTEPGTLPWPGGAADPA